MRRFTLALVCLFTSLAVEAGGQQPQATSAEGVYQLKPRPNFLPAARK
jgi:hypothetical protein